MRGRLCCEKVEAKEGLLYIVVVKGCLINQGSQIVSEFSDIMEFCGFGFG